jgi:Bacterial membrane protein YfhO
MRQGLASVMILSCFGALFLVCYAPALFGDRQFAYRDAGNYYYPLNMRVQAEWNAGRWPLWEPEENGGMPLLGNPTAAVFYPGKLVFAILPYAWGARVYIVAHSALAFMNMFVLMRSWGTSSFGSALSALSYAFGAPILFQSFNIIYLIGAAWLPLGIRAVDRWLRLGRRWALCELAIVLSMQVLGGDPQAAYLLGVASIGYAAALAWHRASSNRRVPVRPQPGFLGRGRLLLLAASVLVVWCAGTLTLAHWLPRLREPGKPVLPLRGTAWVPIFVNVAWGLVAAGFLFHWRRRGGRSPLGVMCLGLAGAATLSAALSAAQLLPVVEFIQQTGRSMVGPRETYQYSLDPLQLVELVWPNILGASFGANGYWRDVIPTPGGRPNLWFPSLYLGGLTLALALGSVAIQHGPPWRVWLTALGAIAILGSLGQYAGPIWLARALAAAPGSSSLVNRLPDFGPLDPIDDTSVRPDGHLRDSDASVYWCLSTVLPGFRQFRYPAKLFTFATLAMAALAGLGWDRLCAGQARLTAPLFLSLVVITSAALAVVVFRKEPILASFRGLTSPLDFGPFEPLAGYRAIARGLVHSIIVFGLGYLVSVLAPRRARLAGAAAVVLMTTDLAAANAHLMSTVPQALFETKPEALQVIENAERDDPSPGPFRIHRMVQWFPYGWGQIASPDRVTDAFSWERDTLFPKYGINFGLEYTHTIGVAQLEDFDRFFTSFYATVFDKQAARYLAVDVGTEVVYYPRRAYDLWNTRYVIAAFDANGWRDPPRSFASFLFQSRAIYPDPDRFSGPDGPEHARNWADTRDFKVFRNLAEYPRSWVVHRARAKSSDTDRPAGPEKESTREILYAADPIWNNGADRVFDPHDLAWVNRGDLAEIRPYLSGLTSTPSEAVRVTYPDPQHAVLEVNLESPGLVILADAYFPGWELTIDGTPAPIYQCNGVMRGAAVPNGSHRLVFTYAPGSFRVGWLVSAAGLAALLVLGLVCARRPVDPTLAGGTSPRSHEKIEPEQTDLGGS